MKKHTQNLIYGLYTCKLLSSVLNNTEPVAMPEGMAVQELYAFQKSQDVSNMAYVALKKLELPESELKEYQDDYKLNILREARFELAGQQVYAELEKAKIPFVPLKGVVVKNLYPNPSLRTFTDVDIFIGDKGEEVKTLMLSLGYEWRFEDNVDAYTKKPSLHFEMHRELFMDDKSFKWYFDEPFNRAVLSSGKEYQSEFSNEDMFIYILAHMYKHFTYGGCGLRMFMDLYVMTKRCGLDFGYIRSELEKIGLDGFLDTTLNVNAFLFDGAETTEDLLDIADYIFNNGTFGTEENKHMLYLVQDTEDIANENSKSKIRYFAERWQLTWPKMKEQFPILRKLPFLLPFFYIFKLFRAVFINRGTIKDEVGDIKQLNGGEEAEFVKHVMEISHAKIK